MSMAGLSNVVYAGNLSWATTDEQLLAFANAGNGVISAQIKRHEDTKRSKGWGLIQFVSSVCAELAVTELNSAALNGRQVHLRIDREGETDPEGASSIYVGNLPWQVLDGELEAAFALFKPYYCRVMRNMSGRSRGFAILKFHTLEDSQEAIKNMHKFEVGGRDIECRDDRGRSFDASTKRAVFVSKVDVSMTDESLSELFSEAGVVRTAKIQLKPDGLRRGWGVVKFDTSEEAQRAIELFNGRVLLDGAPLEVRYDRARK